MSFLERRPLSVFRADTYRMPLGHLNLRYASRCHRDAIQTERTQKVAVLGQGPLPFVNLDGHGRLVACVRRERLGRYDASYTTRRLDA